MPRLKAGICQALSDDVVKALHAVNLRSVADFVAADLESTSKESGVPYKVNNTLTCLMTKLCYHASDIS